MNCMSPLLLLLMIVSISVSVNAVLQIADHIKEILTCRKPSTVLEKPEQSNRPFVIAGRHLGYENGLGNHLAYFSATYYFAAITGRDILIEDNSTYGNACEHVNCAFPFRSDYFPDDFLTVKHRPVVMYECDLMFKFFLGELNISVSDNIIADGFNGGNRCWSQFDPAGDCIKQISNCYQTNQDHYLTCVNGYAISQLFPGPAKVLEDNNELLVGFDKSSELFHVPFQQLAKPPVIDIAIHVRMQFKVFETMRNDSISLYPSEVSDWMASEQYKKLSTALTSQVISVMNSTSTQEPRSDTRPYTVYIAVDNAEVKTALFNHIQGAVSQAIIDLKVPFKLTMMMLNVSNLIHIGHNIVNPLDSQNKFAFIFDWYTLMAAKTMLAWSKMEERGSTYRETLYWVKKYSNYTGPNYSLKMINDPPQWHGF